jgi:hypothetical protein
MSNEHNSYIYRVYICKNVFSIGALRLNNISEDADVGEPTI